MKHVLRTTTGSFLLIAAILIFAVSCKSTKLTTKAQGEKEVEIPCSGGQFQSDKETFRASGQGMSHDQTIAQQKAYSSARGNLAAMLNTTIKRVTDNYLKSVSANATEEATQQYQTITREVVNQQLNSTKSICERNMITADGQYKTYVAIQFSQDNAFKAVNDKLSADKSLKINYDYERFKKEFNKEMNGGATASDDSTAK